MASLEPERFETLRDNIVSVRLAQSKQDPALFLSPDDEPLVMIYDDVLRAGNRSAIRDCFDSMMADRYGSLTFGPAQNYIGYTITCDRQARTIARDICKILINLSSVGLSVNCRIQHRLKTSGVQPLSWMDMANKARLLDAVVAHTQVIVLFQGIFAQISGDVRLLVELALAVVGPEGE